MFFSEPTSSGFFFLAPWIVFLPILGLLVNLIFGARFSERLIGTVASLASGLTFAVSLLLAYSVALHPEGGQQFVAQWIHVGNLSLDWTFRVDSLSATMMLVVSGVGTTVRVGRRASADEIGHAGLHRDAEALVDRRAAEVAVDEDDASAFARERLCHVDRDMGLAGARGCAGDHQHLHVLRFRRV